METSEVWNYFNKKGDIAICKKCPKSLSCKGSTTSSLIRHLTNVHKINIKRKVTEIETDSDSVTGTGCSSNSNLSLENSSQRTSMPDKRKTDAHGSIERFLKKDSMEEMVAKLIAVDGITATTISKSEFIRRAFSKEGFKLPKHQNDIMKLLKKYYNDIKVKVTEKLTSMCKERKMFGITLDEWTSRKNHRYMNINLHGPSGDVINLGLIRIKGTCTAEIAVELVREKLQEFNITFSSIIGSSSDGAAVMVKFGRLVPFIHQLCYNHAIHLAVLDVLLKKKTIFNNNNNVRTDEPVLNNSTSSGEDDEILESSENMDSLDDSNWEDDDEIELQLNENFQAVLNRVRKIVKFFKNSPTRNTILQTYIKEEEGKELTLLLDCRTRWNTICNMIERFLAVRSSIQKALVDLNMLHLFYSNDLIKLQNLVEVLSPIKMAVEKLSSRNMNLLIAEGVLKFLFQTLSNLKSDISREMLNVLQYRIEERRNNDIISLMKYLQFPRYVPSSTDDVFFKMASKTAIVIKLRNVAQYLFSKNVNSDETQANPTERNDNQFSDDELQISEVSQSKNNHQILSEKLQSNIDKILTPMKLQESSFSTSILTELTSYETTGIMSENLKLIFEALKCIQPTSTESERVFSLAGNIVTCKRQRLSDDNINMILFLKSFFLKK